MPTRDSPQIIINILVIKLYQGIYEHLHFFSIGRDRDPLQHYPEHKSNFSLILLSTFFRLVQDYFSVLLQLKSSNQRCLCRHLLF